MTLLTHKRRGTGRYWGIYHQNMLIGTVGLHTLLSTDKTIEISYELHPDYWGHGIATHAAIYCTEYARLHFLNVNTIKAYTLTENKASHRVAEKSGFKRIKLCKNDCFYHGKLIDRILFELRLREDE
jgi:ribosomal-protein-alanine N-acetyltransferase